MSQSLLHLSKTAPTPAIHFLFGELPMEGKIHRDFFSLFYSIWSKPDIKIFKIVKLLLENSSDNRRTWSVDLKLISKMYGLKDPLDYFKNERQPSKSKYLTTI